MNKVNKIYFNKVYIEENGNFAIINNEEKYKVDLLSLFSEQKKYYSISISTNVIILNVLNIIKYSIYLLFLIIIISLKVFELYNLLILSVIISFILLITLEKIIYFSYLILNGMKIKSTVRCIDKKVDSDDNILFKHIVMFSNDNENVSCLTPTNTREEYNSKSIDIYFLNEIADIDVEKRLILRIILIVAFTIISSIVLFIYSI